MKKDMGYIGTEIEVIILNGEGKVVDAFREIARKLPRREIGKKHIDIETSRVTHDVWESQPEINIMPFWEDEFDEFYKELSSLIIDLYEIGESLGYKICLLPLPPNGHSDPLIDQIQPRDAETQSIHYHYSKGGGFPDKRSRLPYYNAFVLTYPILMAATLTSNFGFGIFRNYLGSRFYLGTAIYPPPFIEANKEPDYNYMLKELEFMRRDLGLIHPVPDNIRLFDISFLTKEEAYWLIPQKSTVELRPFDTVPSLLIIEAMWLIIAAIGKKVMDHERAFLNVNRDAFRVIWRLRSRVIKKGFNAKIPKTEKENLPKIGEERWPKFLYDDEITTVKDAFLWLLDDLEEPLSKITKKSTLAGEVLFKFRKFVKDGLTPGERIAKRSKDKDFVKTLLEVCDETIYDPFYVP